MKSEKKIVMVWKTIVILLTAVVFAVAVFLLCYHFDNKYTAKGSQPMDGVLTLYEQDLERHPAIHLIRDWEIYRGKLLSPDDFINNPPLADELVFIGQYGGFEGRVDKSEGARNPHGSATYRLNIALPSEMRSYTLELPEIYSAYKLYINGALMAQIGDPNPQSYRPETGNKSITVQVAERMEILIAVSDYSHFYSGMVYPPAFGNPNAVNGILNLRFGLRIAVSAIALCVGLLYLGVWLFTKKDKINILPLLYSALCVCFVLYTCYPVIKTLSTGGMGFYAVENLAHCAMFLIVIQIQRRLTDAAAVWWKPFAALGVFVCSWALLVPFFLGDSLILMTAYSNLIGIYTWASALFLTVSASLGVWHGKVYSKALLAGIIVFDVALIMDRLLPLYEPIISGWFTEIAGGFVVLVIGFVMAMEVARQFRLRQTMELEIVESRIAIMLSQIQPHFLYNSLTAIGEVCDIDPGRAKTAVTDFAHYLRGNLQSVTKRRMIPFEDELDHVENYLAMERLRFGDKLQVRYEIYADDFMVPPLTVQPIVENAVQHGVMEKDDGGTVCIRTEATGSTICITITDDGVGFDPAVREDDGRAHIGIENVRERLFAMCCGSLEIQSAPGKGTTAIITVPYSSMKEGVI